MDMTQAFEASQGRKDGAVVGRNELQGSGSLGFGEEHFEPAARVQVEHRRRCGVTRRGRERVACRWWVGSAGSARMLAAISSDVGGRSGAVVCPRTFQS